MTEPGPLQKLEEEIEQLSRQLQQQQQTIENLRRQVQALLPHQPALPPSPARPSLQPQA